MGDQTGRQAINQGKGGNMIIQKPGTRVTRNHSILGGRIPQKLLIFAFSFYFGFALYFASAMV